MAAGGEPVWNQRDVEGSLPVKRFEKGQPSQHDTRENKTRCESEKLETEREKEERTNPEVF